METFNPRFLSNLQDEPINILQPISGYEKEPLLSLEDACQPLYPLIDNLEQYIWISKRNCEKPEDGLTQDESASIHLYTMEWNEVQQSFYAKLNRALRTINRQELKPWFRYLKLFLTALFKLPSVQGVVWRGVRGDLSTQYKDRKDQAWWALSSCTLSLNILESSLYLGKTGTRTLFSIETYTGRRIRSHSYFKHEEEILLLPGTYFQIASYLTPAEHLHIIHLKEQKPPFPFLQLPFHGAEFRNHSLQQRIRRRITFSDLDKEIGATYDIGDIKTGYSNLRWHNTSYMHINHALQHAKCKNSGYYFIFQNQQQQHYSSYLALNSCGKSMLIGPVTYDDDTDDNDTKEKAFAVHTIEIRSAFENELEVMILGYKLNVKLFKKKVKLSLEKSTNVHLDWNNIDLITFECANDDDGNKRFHFILCSLEIT